MSRRIKIGLTIVPVIYGWLFPGVSLIVAAIGLGIAIKVVIDLANIRRTTFFPMLLFALTWIAVATVHDLTVENGSSAWWKVMKTPTRNTVAQPPMKLDTPPLSDRDQIKNRIAITLKNDEKAFCEYAQQADCHTAFINDIEFRQVSLNPNRTNDLIVEFSGQGFCGSGGCGIYVLRDSSSGYEKVLEDLGSLDSVRVTNSLNHGYYDLIGIGKSSTSRYKWTGKKYVMERTEETKVQD